MQVEKHPNDYEIIEPSLDEYDTLLDDLYPEIKIGSLTYSPSHVLKNVDPIAYDCGFSDFADDLTTYKCTQCDTEYDTEEEAIACCQYSCPVCGLRYEDEEDAFECCYAAEDEYK